MDMLNQQYQLPGSSPMPSLSDNLHRLYPGAFGGRPVAKTGGAMPNFRAAAKTGSGYALGSSGSTPPPPGAATIPQPGAAPMAMQGMVAPTAQPQASAFAPQAAGMQTDSAFSPKAPAPGAGGGGSNPYGYLSPEDQGKLMDYTRTLYQGPDYKGRNEAAHYLQSLYAQMLNSQAHQAPIDYSGGAEIGRYYDRARSRQAAMDAAMGRSGGGVGAAGQASLYGQQGSAVADMVRQLLEQRRQEQMAQENWMRNLTAQVGHEGLTRNWQKQDSPSFWDSLLGIGGGIAGDVLGGLIP